MCSNRLDMDCLRVLCVVMCVLTCGTRSFVLPPEIEHGEAPACTSYSSICHLAYKYVDDNEAAMGMMQSSAPICKCPGNDTCAVDWDNNNNTIEKALQGAGGLNMVARMSYCHLPTARRPCLFNEAVIVTRGRGPLSFELVGDFRCTCERPLYPHSSWSEGAYDYIQYSCGKPRCVVMRTKVCAVLTYKGEANYEKEYFCRCGQKKQEQCTGVLPDVNRTLTYHWCTNQRLPRHL